MDWCFTPENLLTKADRQSRQESGMSMQAITAPKEHTAQPLAKWQATPSSGNRFSNPERNRMELRDHG